MASSFEEEVLEWALDQDSVQSLLHIAVDKWLIDRRTAINIIVSMGNLNLVMFYEDHDKGAGSDEIDASIISEEYLDKRIYTWIGPTNQTIEHLNCLREKQANQIS